MNSATATLYKEWVSSPENWSGPEEHYEPLGSVITASIKDEAKFDKSVRAVGTISSLRKLYEFRGGLVVERFLRDHRFLNRLLLDAYEEIREHFGVGTRAVLEVVTEPEAQEDQQLFVVIRTKFPPKAARVLLAELDQEWWMDTLPAAQDKMEFALEYI